MRTVRWELRKLMAERGMFQTTDLGRLLAEHGIRMSREQVYRLVTSPPQRLNMSLLVVLCEVLQCTPNDLIQFEAAEARQVVGAEATATPTVSLAPVRARISRPTS